MRKDAALHNKQKEILRISIRLFRKEGFYNVSVEDIVRANNISLATFYSFFPAKEEVVAMFRNESLARCLKFYRNLLENEEYADYDALAQVQAFLLHVMRLMNKVGADFSRVFTHYRIREQNAGPEDKPYLPPLAELIALGQRQGCIREDISAAQLLADTDQMLTGAYLRWQLHQDGHALEEVSAGALSLFCDFLAPAKQLPPISPPLYEVWQNTLYMLIPDPRSDIKRVEDDWLGRFIGKS